MLKPGNSGIAYDLRLYRLLRIRLVIPSAYLLALAFFFANAVFPCAALYAKHGALRASQAELTALANHHELTSTAAEGRESAGSRAGSPDVGATRLERGFSLDLFGLALLAEGESRYRHSDAPSLSALLAGLTPVSPRPPPFPV